MTWTTVPLLYCTLLTMAAPEAAPTIPTLMTTIDLNVGETRSVQLCNNEQFAVKLVDLRETRDRLRGAVREAVVTVEVDGQRLELAAGMYHLPVSSGRCQLDCAVTKGFVTNSNSENPWALDADARLRFWPAQSPWIQPDTFLFPARLRWFSSDTQMTNDPCYVNACDLPGLKEIYYHYGLDFGGAEALVEVVAATDGVVVSARGKNHDTEQLPTTVKPRYDVVYVRDGRGWYYRYSHLFETDSSLQLGRPIKMGDRIGLLGKEGGSGGWSHLHFDAQGLQPSGRYGIIDAYAFAWQAYLRQHPEPLIAVARPHQLAGTGDEVTLDASRSWSVRGPAALARYEWMLSDGSTCEGPRVKRRYERPGHYSEVLKVTDDQGQVDYDFAVVQIYDSSNQEKPTTPAIHAVYWPTFDLRPRQDITFKVRSFNLRPDEGRETWDFGDGATAITQSDGNVKSLAKDGYAIVTHRYEKPGRYLVTVSRTNAQGESATTHLDVIIVTP